MYSYVPSPTGLPAQATRGQLQELSVRTSHMPQAHTCTPTHTHSHTHACARAPLLRHTQHTLPHTCMCTCTPSPAHTCVHRLIMNKVKDLQELVSLSEGQLDRLLGNDSNAKLLWSFLHTQSQVTTRSSQGKKRSWVM